MKKIVNNIWTMVYLIIIFSSVLFNQIFAVNELVISFCISIITGCFVALFSSYNDYCIENNNLIDEFLNNSNFEECISLINNEILQINSEMLNIDKEYTEIWNDLMEKAKEWMING